MKPILDVRMYFDGESEMWWASCDALYLATEAESVEALQQRVKTIAPDCIKDNALPYDPETVQWNFIFPPQETISGMLQA